MRRIMSGLLCLCLLAAPLSADPNPQLVASIENKLARYGLQADVSQFATSTVVQLHFALSSPKGYLKTKRELRHILRTAKFK